MAFVHPEFLWALTALAIPVLLHLFQLRRFKRIDFPNVRLLAEVTRQTRARRKVQHWLVLLARCLALAALVLAFAQPYRPGTGADATAGARAVSIYIDDSFSMDGQNAQGRLLDQARKGAQDLVMAYGPTDRFQVLTGRFLARQQLLLNRDEALVAAAEADAGPWTRKLSMVMARQREALAASEAPTKRAYLLTDLQRGITDVDAWRDDSLIQTVLVPIPPASAANLSLDSAWFSTPVRRLGGLEELHVRLTNRGTEDRTGVAMRLTVDGEQRGIATLDVKAGATADTVLSYRNDEPGLHWAEVAIADQPVTFDDRLHLAYRTIERLHVLLVSGGDAASDRALEAVFRTDSTYALTRAGHMGLDLSSLAGQDLVLLNALPEIPSGLAQALEGFVRAGGSVAVFPPSQGDPARYAPLFTVIGAQPALRLDTGLARVDRIDLEQPFYRDMFQGMPRNVDLPHARERWGLRAAPGSDVLLRTQDGLPFLTRTALGEGHFYVMAAPLNDRSGNITRHALFAATLLRMAELSRPAPAPYAVIGAESVLPMSGQDIGSEDPPHLRGPGGVDLIPEVRRTLGGAFLVLHEADLPPGPYALVRGADTLDAYAMNLSRLEGDLSAYTADELRAALQEHGLTTITVLDASGDLSLRLAELGNDSKPWRWLIILALLMLATETFLLRTKR